MKTGSDAAAAAVMSNIKKSAAHADRLRTASWRRAIPAAMDGPDRAREVRMAAF
jgi:hypothetical protein